MFLKNRLVKNMPELLLLLATAEILCKAIPLPVFLLVAALRGESLDRDAIEIFWY